MTAAEDVSASHGGHLASVASKIENDLLADVTEGKIVWLGGKTIEKNVGWQKWSIEWFCIRISKLGNVGPE